MAYSFHLTGTRRGPDRALLDPYTGKQAMRATCVMSDDERSAVVAVVAKHGGAIVGGGGTVVLAGAEMSFVDVDGPMFGVSVTGAIEPAMDVLFEVATAGRLVVVNDHEKCDEPVPVVTTREAEAQAESVGAESPELAMDRDRFLRLLLPGYRR